MDPEPSLFFSYTIDSTLAIGISGLVVLLFCSALISGAEVALFSLSQKDIEEAIEENNSKGKVISELLEKPKKLLATLLVANNFINIAIVILFSFIGKSIFAVITSTLLRFILEVVVVTFLILLFGEVLPKVYANRNKVKFAKLIAYLIAFLDKILSPISLPMRAATIYLHNKLGKQKTNFSVDQLSQALELTDSEETSTEEQKILEGIVSFGNTETRQVMSPRIDIFALEIEESFSEICPKIIEKGHSRIPVYRDNIDHIEGVLFVKDLLPYINSNEFDWKSLLRQPFFVPENKKLDNLLKDFQSKKSHLAIVVDEYGGTSGLVSLEDVIEEIVGDISDEFDDENNNFTQIDDRNYLFEGKINLKDFYRIIDVDEELFEIQKGEAETLGGFILEILGNFPKKDQKIIFENCVFTIEVVDKKRIKQIKVTIE
ncbi:MAG TPA: gliding motility-associated protein GldE [Flavobacterium sp.]|uniref:gliding motility-associated protein GldE n=1 Tax=Flavobacterium sp. TaxID=239 RepID=UPI001B505D6B|nr:gliding motility-associated protein GldE [Flavobacterium sp.]MBP7182437.1 gliding motility-associated protein GldE [Flavobacterium sp.]MBP7317157.1 gliding motility-associated protein GldE [Flavobacterium sp.]MBP8887277.1 gliding motility-associated protein GldE [Flavobacterium sp.]HRL71987.1 gliding motility-associated protein GldE [Flavobacterium sp.]HRM11816.1 gliding motility-associated protein GldE [Flavobacterium sp.]